MTSSIAIERNFTLDELTQPPKFIKTFALFGKENEIQYNSGKPLPIQSNPAQYIPGRVTLIQLSSGRYILASNLMGEVRSASLTEEEGKELIKIVNNEKLKSFEKGWFEDEAPKNYKQYGGSYHSITINSVIINKLYGEDWNSNPLKKITAPIFTLAHDNKGKVIKIDNKSSALELLKNAMQENQNTYVKDLHVAMDEDSISHKIAKFIPFYNTIYSLSTDSKYKIDADEVFLDTISILPGVSAAGKIGSKVSATFKTTQTALKKGMSMGLRGKSLIKYVGRKVGPEAKDLLKNSAVLTAEALYDIVEPIPIKSVGKALYKSIDKNGKLVKSTSSSLMQMVAGDGVKHSPIRTDWSVYREGLDSIPPNEKGIYRIPNDNKKTMQDYDYFIKHDDRFYKVKYDADNDTYRLVDPRTSGNTGYSPPVERVENNKWRIHSNIGLKGGGLFNLSKKSESITIGDYQFNKLEYDENLYKEMNRIGKSYIPYEGMSAKNLEKIEQYKEGKELAGKPFLEKIDEYSFNNKMLFYNDPETNSYAKGVMAGRLNKHIIEVENYKTAKDAEEWKTSAKKAYKVILLPQDIYLKGKPGTCLPASILMGLALQRGKGSVVAKKLMNIYGSENISNNTLYNGLTALYADGRTRRFSGRTLTNDTTSYLDILEDEHKLFNGDNGSIRVDIGDHTVLLSKTTDATGKPDYVFYDPNYGMAHFEKYEDCVSFFKQKMANSDFSPTLIKLDFSHVAETKINGKTLIDIMDDTQTTPSSAPVNAQAPQIPTQQYLQQLSNLGVIPINAQDAKGKCADVMPRVANYMREHGFTNIKFRGMHIWDPAIEKGQTNHFVVVGERNNQRYVFDLTASQFSTIGMEGLDGPLILTEPEWIDRYANASTTKLIYYTDFSSRIRAEAKYHNNPETDPVGAIENKKYIKIPPWYYVKERLGSASQGS